MWFCGLTYIAGIRGGLWSRLASDGVVCTADYVAATKTSRRTTCYSSSSSNVNTRNPTLPILSPKFRHNALLLMRTWTSSLNALTFRLETVHFSCLHLLHCTTLCPASKLCPSGIWVSLSEAQPWRHPHIKTLSVYSTFSLFSLPTFLCFKWMLQIIFYLCVQEENILKYILHLKSKYFYLRNQDTNSTFALKKIFNFL